jgi:hypothetical protein
LLAFSSTPFLNQRGKCAQLMEAQLQLKSVEESGKFASHAFAAAAGARGNEINADRRPNALLTCQFAVFCAQQQQQQNLQLPQQQQQRAPGETRLIHQRHGIGCMPVKLLYSES